MRRFQFRLERVLQWQLEVCRVKENDVRQCLSAITGTDARMAQLEAARSAAEQYVLNHPALTASDLTALAQFRLRAAAEHKSLATLRAAQLRDVERARESLLSERRQLRLLEKLRGRALSAYGAAADREAEAQAAEAYASRWVSEASANRAATD